MAAVTAQEVNEYMSGLGDFSGHGTVTVEEVGDADVRLRWPYNKEALRPGGYISGPTMFTMADLAGWVLVFATEGITPMAVTWDLHITFLRPAIGGDLIAKAKQLKRGRKLVYGDVTMYIEGKPDKPVCHATVTYALPDASGT